MKANELRIGNYYQVKDKCLQLTHIQRDDSENIILPLKDIGGKIYGYYKFEDVRPIPLTEEWLIKLGFEKKPEYSWKGNGYDYQPETSKTVRQDYWLNGFIVRYETWSWRKTESDEWINDLSVCIGMVHEYHEKVGCDISPNEETKSVHQLQNLYFALTGEELTVN